MRLHAKSSSGSASTSAAGAWDEGSEDTQPFLEPHLGPSFLATLKMLEWQALCSQLADFANTHAGRQRCLNLTVPPTLAMSHTMIEETRAVTLLEFEFSTTLDFGGIATQEAEAAIKRASKVSPDPLTQPSLLRIHTQNSTQQRVS
jgi:hypothetical protein